MHCVAQWWQWYISPSKQPISIVDLPKQITSFSFCNFLYRFQQPPSRPKKIKCHENNDEAMQFLFGQWVIQQLRGPNFIQFWPPIPLEWTIVDILHTIYPLFTWQNVDFLLTTYLPLLVHIVIEWPSSLSFRYLTNAL